MDDADAAEGLGRVLDGADRIVVQHLPLPWCHQARPWWSLVIVERALGLGSQVAPVDEVALWQRYRQAVISPGWVWGPDVWPWPPDGLPSRPERERQAKAWQSTAVAIHAAQQQRLTPVLTDHLGRIEMEAERIHGVITMTGAGIDLNRLRQLRQHGPEILGALASTLMQNKLAHPGDDIAVLRWLSKRDMHLEAVDDDELKALQTRDPLVRDLRQWRRLDQLLRQPMIHGDMIGPDGRAHPRNIIIGAPTTRTVTINPSITGVQKELRPMVVPADGYGIGESDVASMELCVAAARYGDRDLATLCNTGHALAALVQSCNPRMAGVDLTTIKRDWPLQYALTKTTTYGLFYGRTAKRIGEALGIQTCQAELLVRKVLAECPQVAVGMRNMIRHVQKTHRVPIANGLGRKLTREDIISGYRIETLAKNTPIQSLAAIVFRAMVIAVAAALVSLGGRIVLVNHDSIIWEAPLPRMSEAARCVEEAMRQAFQAILGDLVKPTVESTVSAPWCWNKDGNADSFDRFLADPTFRIGQR
jgi:DNA polymerase I-like protein with 3'-5' exonuclease and polymerase domains